MLKENKTTINLSHKLIVSLLYNNFVEYFESWSVGFIEQRVVCKHKYYIYFIIHEYLQISEFLEKCLHVEQIAFLALGL